MRSFLMRYAMVNMLTLAKCSKLLKPGRTMWEFQWDLLSTLIHIEVLVPPPALHTTSTNIPLSTRIRGGGFGGYVCLFCFNTYGVFLMCRIRATYPFFFIQHASIDFHRFCAFLCKL